MEKWMVAAKKADFNRLAKTFSISPVLARLMVNRGLKTDEEFQQFLYGDLSVLHRPEKMKDMDRGLECIRRAIDGGQLICIATVSYTHLAGKPEWSAGTDMPADGRRNR